MGKICAVFGCATNSARKSGVSTFAFPKGPPERRRAWINFVKTTRKNFGVPTTYSVICAKHFAPECFESEHITALKASVGKRTCGKLMPGTVPTIYPESTKTVVRKNARDDTPRRQRTLKRELVKSIHDLQKEKKARPSIPPLVLPDAESETENEDDCYHAIEDEALVTSALGQEQPSPTPLPTCVNQSVMARIKPYQRSKAVNVAIGPATRDCATQCDLIAPCHCQYDPDKPPSPICSSSPLHFWECSVDAEFTIFDFCNSEDVVSEPADTTYQPGESSMSQSEENITMLSATLDEAPSSAPDPGDRKYVVCRSSLLELFRSCSLCGHSGRVEMTEVGTLLRVTFSCKECSHVFSWNSQPVIGQMPVGNLLLSASILFTGCLAASVYHLLDTMNIAHMSERAYYNHQKKYLQPVVISRWGRHQLDLLDQLASMDGGLILSGDGRSDSPGHCAKYGGFNTIECRLNKVIDIQVVQSNEVGNSARCENEGLRRCLAFLRDAGHDIDALITDRHKMNEKYIREQHPNIQHFFDVWHVAKGLSKKLTQLANKGGMEKVGDWRRSIVNHLHWVAASTPDGDGNVMLAKWDSLLNHIVNKHQGHNNIFPRCLHEQLEEGDRTKDWFRADSDEFLAISSILENRFLRKDIPKLSPLHQTSALESFHSLILRFCPKHTAFSYLGMYCRLLLAAFHYNENSEREVLTNGDGSNRVKVYFPKSKKGEYSVRPLKQNPTYNYRSRLVKELFAQYSAGPALIYESMPDRFKEKPDPLSASHYHPTSEEAMTTYVSRYVRD